MSQPPIPQGISHLRCSDEDRELVAQVLNNAYADGRLDFEEHNERITRAYNAKTFGDLDGLTLDLVPARAPEPAPAVRARATAPVPADMFTGGRAILANYRPGGPLVMPAYSEITCVLGDARIDLVGATFTARETTIRVNAILGDVRIRVPAGVRVVCRVGAVLGDTKMSGMSPDADQVTLIVDGTAMLADVKILGPDSPPRKYDRFI